MHSIRDKAANYIMSYSSLKLLYLYDFVNLTAVMDCFLLCNSDVIHYDKTVYMHALYIIIYFSLKKL